MNKFNRVHFLFLFVACLFVATTVTPFKRERASSRHRISDAFNKSGNPQLAMNEFAAPSPEQAFQQTMQEPAAASSTGPAIPTATALPGQGPATDKPELSLGDQIKQEVDEQLRQAHESARQARIAAGIDPDMFTHSEDGDPEQSAPSFAPATAPTNKAPLAPIDDAPKNAHKILPPALEEKEPEVGESYEDPNLDLPLEFQSKPAKKKETIEQAQEALKNLEEEKYERVEFNFENADLKNLVTYVESLFDLNFITDESIEPIKKNGKAISHNKISFKTNEPLTRQQAWNLFTTFLELAGFAVVPTGDHAIYRIETLPNARKAPIPAYIGVDSKTLPDNDEIIRYVYFLKNGTLDTIIPVIQALHSPDAVLMSLKAQKGFILTDKAYNIKTLMEIVKELDRVTMPQSMSVLKLHNADAQEVKRLYESLLASPDQRNTPRVFGPRKPETSNYFPEDTRIIAEPRTNSLILLGTRDSIKQIETFITKYVDVDLDQPYSPLYVHQLRYADAVTVADIMREVTRFGGDTPVGKAGGVRAGDKYLREMTFTPEKATNRVVIKGDYEDYLRAKEIIEKLDEAQPQVAIEILILDIHNTGAKQLGAQVRSKAAPSGLFGTNVKWQTSGLNVNGVPSGIVEQPGAVPGVQRLLGNLLNLVNPMSAGNTILTLGQDIYGVWGIFQALETVTNLEIISNPFLMATNKTKAKVSLGETRRVVTSTIAGSAGDITSQSDEPASLTVEITPQINSDGMISLDFVVDITDFLNPTDFTSATKTVKRIVSKTIVADQEVLALGGLVRNVITNTESKVPILGDIPLIGWLFKNKNKSTDKENLLILVSTRIVRPDKVDTSDSFTLERVADYRSSMHEMVDLADSRDPIHKMFFADNVVDTTVEEFIFDRRREGTSTEFRKKRVTLRDRRKAAKENRKKKKKAPEPLLEQIAIDAPELALNRPRSNRAGNVNKGSTRA